MLGDFRTDARVLVLAALAVPIGIVSALVAKALLWLIAVISNIVFYQRFSPVLGSLVHHHLGAWVILAPVVGALVIGVMARYGSEKIRGHGIPEALEAILLGGSVIQPKVAFLKPLSSAISIGTGGPFGAEGPYYYDWRRVRLDPRSAISFERSREENIARCRRSRWNVGGLRFTDRGDIARGRAVVV